MLYTLVIIIFGSYGVTNLSIERGLSKEHCQEIGEATKEMLEKSYRITTYRCVEMK